MASNITVSDLTIAPGIGHNIARWSVSDPNEDGLPYRQLANVELWAASSNDRAGASKVAEGSDSAPHMGLVEGQTFYYWIKARDREGSYGEWFPSGATSGVLGTVGFGSATTALINGKIVCSVSSNALTVAIKTLAGNDPSSIDPVLCGFRDQSGAYVVRALTSAKSAVVPSGATLGAANGVPFRVWFALFDDDGVVHVAVAIRCNPTTLEVFALSEFGDFENSKELNTGADTAGQAFYYAGVDGAQHPFRVIGFADWDSGLATVGTWNAGPTRTVLFGPGIRLAGEEINESVAEDASVGTVTADIPYDDTIPQDTEGGSDVSGAIRATAIVNVIRVDFTVRGSNSNASSLVNTAALFRANPPVASAIGVAWGKQGAVNEPLTLSGGARERAGMTGNITYGVKVGGSANGATSWTRNGINGSRKYGGVMKSEIKMREIVV